MKMQCPVCGAKLKNNVCPYCKTVTTERIKNASNKAVKEARQKQETEQVVYSSFLPKDISKKKLWVFAVLLGWFGAHNFYVKKTMKGWFYLVAFAGAFVFTGIRMLSELNAWGVENGVQIFVSLFNLCAAITFLLWIGDLVMLAVGKFKVPVVLPETVLPNGVKKNPKHTNKQK